MRDNAKPSKLSEFSNYFLVRDDRIPTKSKENIILKPSGVEIIARYYFQKYGVIIRVCSEFLKIDMLAAKIQEHLFAAKKVFPHAKKMGFIFISNDDPDDVFGHALPMIWEEGDREEHLFFLDTTQYLGGTACNQKMFGNSRTLELVQLFRKKLLSLMPNLRLWGLFGCRQIDYSSCYTDALVMLRDGLRVPLFKVLCSAKIKEVVADEITIFYAPDCLLRTAQIGSYSEKSHANLNAVIRMCHNGVEKRPETLEQFRDRFDVPVEVNGMSKKFGTFTLFKARQYVANIESRELAKQTGLPY